jgi:hypothetical protein
MFGSRHFGPRYFGGRYFGHSGFSAPGFYRGSRYFGNRYFGSRYFGSDVFEITFNLAQTTGVAITGTVQTGGSSFAFGSDFTVTQVTGITLSGTLLTNGALVFGNDDWAFTPPLEVATLAGSIAVAGNITIGAPVPGYGGYWGKRYFGGRYFGARYFGAPDSWNVEQTAGISLSGGVNVTGSVGTLIALSPSTLALTGSLLAAGDVSASLSTADSTGAILYVDPYAIVDLPAYSTDANLYIQARSVTGVYSAGIQSNTNPNSAAVMPSAQHPLGIIRQDGTIMIDPTWDRFLRYQWENRLGGIAGQSIPEVSSTVVSTQEKAAQIEAEVNANAQQTQANAESLSVVVQVAQNSSLPGADQIPPVRLSPGENIP